MGVRCNTRYKGTADVLHDKTTGNHRRAFDPYGDVKATVSLLNGVPFAGRERNLMQLPKWEVDLLGPPDAVETWDQVFQIRKRYEFDILDGEYRDWIKTFANWCADAVGVPATADDLASAPLSILSNSYSRRYRRNGVPETRDI